MNQFLLFVLLASFISGCTAIKPTNFEHINKLGQTKSATVTLVSGEVVNVQGLRVDADSTRWLAPENTFQLQTNSAHQLPLSPVSTSSSEIISIAFPSKKTGFFKGARNGFIVGAGFGAIEGYIYEKRTSYACTNPEPAPSVGLKGPGCQAFLGAISSGVVLGILGAGTGAIIGGISSRGKHLFHLQSDPKKN